MANTDIFLGSGASLTFIPESDIYVGGQKPSSGGAFDGSSHSSISTATDFQTNFDLVTDLYVGCLIERYNSSNVLQSTHRITANTATDISLTPDATCALNDYFVIRNYGAPVPAPSDTAKRLLSDEWLGILESATFPTTEVEMKQLNTSLGGSRNFTCQYKGIETASGANLGIVANHAAWLFYFFFFFS